MKIWYLYFMDYCGVYSSKGAAMGAFENFIDNHEAEIIGFNPNYGKDTCSYLVELNDGTKEWCDIYCYGLDAPPVDC